jgi:hypothetical protein
VIQGEICKADVVEKGFNMWAVISKCNCNRDVQYMQSSNLEPIIISHAYPYMWQHCIFLALLALSPPLRQLLRPLTALRMSGTYCTASILKTDNWDKQAWSLFPVCSPAAFTILPPAERSRNRNFVSKLLNIFQLQAMARHSVAQKYVEKSSLCLLSNYHAIKRYMAVEL